VSPRNPVPREYAIKSIQQALDVLEVFGPDDHELTLAEIGERLGAPSGTVQKLVENLRGAGLIEQNDWSGHFRLGMRLWELGAQALTQFSPWHELRRATQTLATQMQAPAVTAVLQGGRAVYVEGIRGRAAASGRAWPAHASALGKALLASLTPEQLETTLAEMVLEPWTAHTITDLDTLRADLQQTRERGYALEDGELAAKVVSLGAPVSDHTGTVVAAIGVQLRPEHIKGARLKTVADAVIGAANLGSRHLGAAGAAQAARPLSLQVDVLGVPDPPLEMLAHTKTADSPDGAKPTPPARRRR
jgi:DNA-binding IclR family transcriptional regulator